MIEVFDDSNKIGADVVLLHNWQQCMPNPVEGLLEVYEDMVEVGLAGAGHTSHRRFLAWWFVLLCSFLLWSLSVLQQGSFPLEASICSVWTSAWLCFGGWWGWLFGSSGTTAGCLSWEVWWPWIGSKGLAILLSARSCCRLSWERWLHLLHLLGPVLLGCYQLQLTFLFSAIVLQPPLLCEEWVGRFLRVSRDSSVLMDLHWPSDCTAQSSILPISSVFLVLLTQRNEAPITSFENKTDGLHNTNMWLLIAIIQPAESTLILKLLVTG